MNSNIKISNNASVCVIDIEGIIGVAEECQFSASSQSVATYDRFREELAKIKEIEAKEVVVNIRSAGGDVNDAILIYESLSALNAKITTRCYGYTASAATIIAQAASEGCREIANSALYLVHQSSSTIEGNSTDLAEIADLLAKTDDRIASLYALRSSRKKEAFEALMRENGGRGRWLSPEEVIEAGLADKVIGVEEATRNANLFAKVKGLFSPSRESIMSTPPVVDNNILHLPKESLGSTSALALKAGQLSAMPSSTRAIEDPVLEDISVAHNALAYAEDALTLRMRGR